jgi:hypothetical protein
MASHLNLLLANSPAPFLERTVLVMDGLNEPSAARLLRTKTVNFFDLEAEGRKAKIRVFAGLRQYTDAPLHGYYLDAGGTAVLPMREDLCQFCFLRTFSNSRLYVAREGASLLRIYQEQLLGGGSASAVGHTGNMLDEISWCDCLQRDVVGPVQGNALLYKRQSEPWSLLVQQIVGVEGRELVHRVVHRPLQY